MASKKLRDKRALLEMLTGCVECEGRKEIFIEIDFAAATCVIINFIY